jgi:glycosyltransferase involved in cell wall biosynthesis
MKLLLTMLVRDEKDVITTNIAYHLSRGVDHIIVTDNCSLDGTREIIEEFARAGNVTLIKEETDNYNQSVWVTRMARRAAEMGADWVIHNDADEMWWPVEGDLKSTLERIPPEYGSVSVQRTNALPLRKIDGHPFARMTFRYVSSVNGLGHSLPGKTAHRAAADVELKMGNHALSSPSLGPSVETEAITIFHFPYRSFEHFERKIVNGGAALARNTALSEKTADVWRQMYHRVQTGTLRDWYDALPHVGDPGFQEWIARGEVVLDARLADYLREMAGVVQGVRGNRK